MPPDCEFEHAVEVAASARAAWEFWTKVENWSIDPAVEWVSLDGPFEAGGVGETKQRGLTPVRWSIAESRADERATIEVDLPGATARFSMGFEAVSENSSRLRQRITIEGPEAEKFAAGLGPGFGEGVRAGMRRLADAIEQEAAARG